MVSAEGNSLLRRRWGRAAGPWKCARGTGGGGGFRRLEGSRNDGGHGGGQRVKVLLPAASAVDTSPSWIRGTRKFMRGRTGGRSFL